MRSHVILGRLGGLMGLYSNKTDSLDYVDNPAKPAVYLSRKRISHRSSSEGNCPSKQSKLARRADIVIVLLLFSTLYS